MNRNTRLWKIGLVIVTSLLLSITGCTWTDDIWGESAETQSSESAAQVEPEPHQVAEVPGNLEDSDINSQRFPVVQERIALAFPSTGLLSRSMDRVKDGNKLEWPEMNYLGEAVIFQESTVIPEELRIVEGGSIAVMYSPEEDQMLDAPTGIPRHLQGHPLPAVMIPPRSSLVMVRMGSSTDVARIYPGKQRRRHDILDACGKTIAWIQLLIAALSQHQDSKTTGIYPVYSDVS
jgi:hypothetical protein